MKKFIPAIIALLFLMAGCATEVKIDDQLYNQYLTRTYNFSKDSVFKATLAALKETNTGVEKLDREKGRIITERTIYSVSTTGALHRNSHKYYFQISGIGNNATIKVYKYRLWFNDVEETMLSSPEFHKKLRWDPLFKEIQNQLEEM